MEYISIALAIPPLVELLARLVPKTAALIKSYHHAGETVTDKIVEFADHTQKLQLELEEFRQLSPDLPDDIKQHFGRLFVTLRAKLSDFETEMDVFLQSRHIGVRVVLSSVTKIVEVVTSWQQRVEDFFELLNRWPKPFKDPRAADPSTPVGRVRIVSEAIFAATEKTPEWLDRTDKPLPQGLVELPHSTVIMSETATSSHSQTGVVILEAKSIAPDVSDEGIRKIRQDVMDLARVLSAEDLPNRGILKCTGYRYLGEIGLVGKPGREFVLEFEAPPQLRRPKTLRALLVDKDFKGKALHPLNERFSLAKQLARAVLHVHSKKHVHKNIRPETILLFESAPSNPAHPGNEKAFPVSLGTAFLIGFQRVRKDEADTTPIETDWSEDIYRHPSRQGTGHAEEKYNMLHDVYSLGVCLLEIALWNPLVEWDAQGRKVNNTKACNLMEQPVAGMERRILAPKRLQEKLIRDAKKRVPIVLGEKFSRAVLRCLQCVETFGIEAQHDPFIGLRYIDQVLEELEGIAL